jgi:hypothetical protein
MEHDHQSGGRSQSGSGSADRAADEARKLGILKRYAAGEISAREAAKELSPAATEHDVYAGILQAHLPLPLPSAEVIAQEVETLRQLYGES